MIRDIVFVVLLYLITGVVLAIVSILRIWMSFHRQTLVATCANHLGISYNTALMDGAIGCIFIWPYLLFEAIVLSLK